MKLKVFKANYTFVSISLTLSFLLSNERISLSWRCFSIEKKIKALLNLLGASGAFLNFLALVGNFVGFCFSRIPDFGRSEGSNEEFHGKGKMSKSSSPKSLVSPLPLLLLCFILFRLDITKIEVMNGIDVQNRKLFLLTIHLNNSNFLKHQKGL